MREPKRYLLFTGSLEHPARGWLSFHASFDAPEEARAAGNDYLWREPHLAGSWYQIVDARKQRLLEERTE